VEAPDLHCDSSEVGGFLVRRRPVLGTFWAHFLTMWMKFGLQNVSAGLLTPIGGHRRRSAQKAAFTRRTCSWRRPDGSPMAFEAWPNSTFTRYGIGDNPRRFDKSAASFGLALRCKLLSTACSVSGVQ